MIDNQRRNLVIGALLAPLAASITLKASAADKPMHPHAMPDMGPDMNKVPWMGDEQIAMLVYPGMTVMDLVGPHCMFGSLMGAKIYIVAKSLDPVTSDAGLA
ncbi:DJ-1/PfpI family protein, partial [Pseudomonas savastanoi pv. glycinea]